MDQATHNKIVSFIWGIADDVLRDLFKRGKYPDVILPMCVIRRMDAVLEPTKQRVLGVKEMLDKAGIAEQRDALCAAAGQAFYNTSKFTLRDLQSCGSQQRLLANFKNYLNGFSPNVQDILENFKFRNQLQTLSKADAIGTLINKFLDPDIDLSPAGIDNHAMGTVFEELVRKFNEDNNEEAGEHWTPRDAVRLMANLVFLPIEARIKSGLYRLYDCACGTGGMLTVAEETLAAIAAKRGQQVQCWLYGQESQPETYAVCKADMLLKGEGESAEHIVGGAAWSTLSHDAFPAEEFDFMLANPPYGKSWKKDLEKMGGKEGVRDPRFRVMHKGEELSLVTRSSDGQMLFLANMASKMNARSALGSRIAEVHNGSSLFTGDAGQGESNIRRWLIENDWLEAIVALPLNLFYNTGIATYIWVLSNRKPTHRKGRVQLIDASQWYKPLRKNLGKKNCELSPDDIERISRAFLDFKETPESKIFPNAAFGYWKVTVERPLRLADIDPARAYKPAEIKRLKESRERAEDAPPVIRKIHKRGAIADPLRGLFEATVDGKAAIVEYEPDADLRDTEQVPLLEEGGIEAFIRREVLPYTPDLPAPRPSPRQFCTYVLKCADDSFYIGQTDHFARRLKQHKNGEVSWTGPRLPVEPIHWEVFASREEAVKRESKLKTGFGRQWLKKKYAEGKLYAAAARQAGAWIKPDSAKVGYEISFTRHFYKPQPLRTLEEISADILAIEKEAEGLLDGLLKGGIAP